MKALFSLALFFLGNCAFAAAGPQSVVEDIFARAGDPQVSASAAKQAEVSHLVNFDALAKAALGKEAAKLDAKEIVWFRDTLTEIITLTVYPKAPDFLKDVHITYNSVDAQDTAATVKSTVQNKADLTDVDYRLERKGESEWRVVDVAIAGQSWVDSIREQVAAVVKKKKWAGLKENMQRRLNELKSGKA